MVEMRLTRLQFPVAGLEDSNLFHKKLCSNPMYLTLDSIGRKSGADSLRLTRVLFCGSPGNMHNLKYFFPCFELFETEKADHWISNYWVSFFPCLGL